MEEIIEAIVKILKNVDFAIDEKEIRLDHPGMEKFGDWSSNIAMLLGKTYKVNPKELALKFKDELDKVFKDSEIIEKIEVKDGYLNFYLKVSYLIRAAEEINFEVNFKGKVGKNMKGRKVMVEYAHPNTHKELHIGHMRTLITGESLSRILEINGVQVFRANYQGDIGPHVAKAIWGTSKILEESGESYEQWEKKSYGEKAHLLGKGYVRGCTDYEKYEREIDNFNQELYKGNPKSKEVYDRTRRWSLDYYEQFYKRLGTKFDKLFFESEVADEGKKIVIENLGKVFENSQEAIIFDGEKYGLHKRVFVTKLGTPTYEGKEMGLAVAQRNIFEYDKNIHVVGNEQNGYFQVVIKAMEMVDGWYKGKQYHLPMGMVSLVGKKMSSRTGEILKVDDLLDEVKKMLIPMIKKDDLTKSEVENIAETTTIAAVKFSILKSDPRINSVFDINKSVDIEGDSGPYVLYTYSRCLSVLNKTKILEQKDINMLPKEIKLEEASLLKVFYKFENKIKEAAQRLNPAVITEYLLTLAKKFNEFYGKYRIIGEDEEIWRIFLTRTTASTLKTGMEILGIKTLERM